MEKALREYTVLREESFPMNIFMLLTDDDRVQNYMHVHWHDHLELVYIMRGTATMQIDTTFSEVRAGDVVFVNSKQIHSTSNEAPGTIFVAIVFNERLIRNANLDLTEFRYILPIIQQEFPLSNFLDQGDPLTGEVVEAIHRLSNEFFLESVGYELCIKSELLKILSMIIRYSYQYVDARQPTSRFSYTKHPLDGIFQYLVDHLHEPLTLTGLAQQYNVSASHFCRLFKQLTGNTLIQYLNQLRVRQSERLLRETILPISEIAEQVGFNNLSHFERVFRQVNQQSPSKFRSEMR